MPAAYRHKTPRALGALFLGALLLALALPLWHLFAMALGKPLLAILSDAPTWHAIWHSLYTSFLGMLLAVLLGCLCAFVLVLTDIRAKRFYTFALMLPLMIPPQVTALAWLQLTGAQSPVLMALGIAPPLGSAQPLYSGGGIALLLGLQAMPLVFMALRAQLLALPQELIEASRISGASGLLLWRDIIVPLCRTGLISGAGLAFIASLGNFGISAMLGIPAGFYTLPTLIYQKMASFGTSMLAEVASLALLMALITLGFMLAQQALLKRQPYALLGQAKAVLVLRLGKSRLLVEFLLAAVLFLLVGVALIALVLSSLSPALGVDLTWDNLSLQSYHAILFQQSASLRATFNSLFLATGAAFLLMLLALVTVYILQNQSIKLQTLAYTLIELPFALPGVVLAIALILWLVKPLPIVNISLYSTIWLILIAYLLRFFATASKPIAASARELPPSLAAAAQIAGANSQQRFWQIFVPLLLPAMAAGAVLVFLTAVNELTVSALLYSAGNETLGVMVYQLEDGGESILAAALAVLMVILVLLLMWLLGLLRHKLPRGVIPW